MSGPYAYVAGGGMQVLDVSNPARPALVASVGGGPGRQIALTAGAAYILWDDLRVIDITDPLAPSISALLETPGESQAIAVSRGIAFIADADAGLQLIDISSCAGCVGDFNGDGHRGTADLLLVLGAWGPCSQCPEDLDGDCSVGLGDLLMILNAWGPCR